MPATPPFHLKKWYFDGIDASGRTMIAYSADLHWRGIHIPYSSYLYYGEPGDIRSESRFTQAGLPDALPGAIQLTYKGLPLTGQWQAASNGLDQRLYEGEDGYLDWHCRLPAGQCHIQLGQEPPLTGWGYVELLEMTLPPWRLGIRELRWGRFADPEWPLVWIEWLGEPNRRWVFANGQLFRDEGTVSENLVQAQNHSWSLRLENPVVLEDKEKMKEVFQSLAAFIPGIDRLAPLRFIQATETKWRSEGVLHRPGHADRKGWVIHELVKF